MKRTNVYVDGFNLFYGALKGTRFKWLDLDALSHQLLPKDNIHRIRYFTAKVSARPGDPRLPVEIIKTEEKGSDVALATYLMLDACRGDCSTAVLITNDSDLSEPLRLVREELGLTTGVINPHEARKRSRALQATFFKQLRPGALAASQFPSQVTDFRGRKITKPVGW